MVGAGSIGLQLADPICVNNWDEVAFILIMILVAVTPNGAWVLVAVHGSSQDAMVVVDLATRTITTTLALSGQPDSVAISPDGRYVAVAIENERNEDVNGGEMPQSPAGMLTIVDLASGAVVTHWSAGTTTHLADTVEDNDIQFVDQLIDARREPDAIAWTPGGRLVTANEGDYDLDLDVGDFVGGRDFTVFSRMGEVLFEPGAALELEAVRHDHYPDERSGNKGIETEGVAIAVYDHRTFLFVGSERGNFVAVYRLDDEIHPEFVQILPPGVGPEGLLPIPQRSLFVAANEEDGTISIFQRKPEGMRARYPQVVSHGLPGSALFGRFSSGAWPW